MNHFRVATAWRAGLCFKNNAPVRFVMRHASLLVLAGLAAVCGCAQHDLFHPGSISSGEAESHIVKRVLPAFPAIAKQEHVNGLVVLSVVIDEQGNVTNVTPVSGPALLRPAFVAAVKQWKYKPFEENGVPLEMRTIISLDVSFGG